MLVTMSQTMMGMTQMLVQGAGSGYHPPTQAFSPQSVQPNCLFSQTAFRPVVWAMVSIQHQPHHHLQAQLLVNQDHLKKTTTIASRNC